jgi:hypothetical protein
LGEWFGTIKLQAHIKGLAARNGLFATTGSSTSQEKDEETLIAALLFLSNLMRPIFPNSITQKSAWFYAKSAPLKTLTGRLHLPYFITFGARMQDLFMLLEIAVNLRLQGDCCALTSYPMAVAQIM